MVKKTMCLSAFASYMLSFLTCLHFFTFFTRPSFFFCLYFHVRVTCPHFLGALSAFIFLPALRAFNLLRARLTFIFFTCLHFFTCLVCIGAREKIFQRDRAKIVRKILLHENMLMIQSTIYILRIVFTYFIICLRNKKMSP